MAVNVTVIDKEELADLKNMIRELVRKNDTLVKMAMVANEETWLTVNDAAAYTKLSIQTIVKYQDQIGYSQPTGAKSKRFKLKHLNDWFYQHYIKRN